MALVASYAIRIAQYFNLTGFGAIVLTLVRYEYSGDGDRPPTVFRLL